MGDDVRVPRFAVLGRLGLPVAAVIVALALWSTTTWALASPKSVSPPAACSHVPLHGLAVTTSHCEVTTDGSALTLLARTTVVGRPFQKASQHR
jgi:hypothetical protein